MSNLGEGFETRYIERDSGILDHLDGLLTTLVRVKQNEPNKAPLTKANVASNILYSILYHLIYYI
jgi:hypothetical protein